MIQQSQFQVLIDKFQEIDPTIQSITGYEDFTGFYQTDLIYKADGTTELVELFPFLFLHLHLGKICLGIKYVHDYDHEYKDKDILTLDVRTPIGLEEPLESYIEKNWVSQALAYPIDP